MYNKRFNKKNVLLARYSVFCVFDESTNFKICYVTQILLQTRSYTFHCFFIIVRSTRMFLCAWYKNETYSGASTTYEKHFQNIFSSILKTRN